jgi:hypothetical protein
MPRSGFLGVLFLSLVALVAGLVGYQAGLTSNAVASGATVVVTGGFPGFGTLFFLLFLGFLFFSFAGRRRAHWAGGHGHGLWGRGAGPGGGQDGHGSFGGPGDPGDPRRQWVVEMHRSLHAEDKETARRSDGIPPDHSPAG